MATASLAAKRIGAERARPGQHSKEKQRRSGGQSAGRIAAAEIRRRRLRPEPIPARIRALESQEGARSKAGLYRSGFRQQSVQTAGARQAEGDVGCCDGGSGQVLNAHLIVDDRLDLES